MCVAIFQPNFGKWPQTIVAWIQPAQYGIRNNSDAADWQKQNVINFVLKTHFYAVVAKRALWLGMHKKPYGHQSH